MIAHVIGGIEEEDKELLEKGVATAEKAIIEIMKSNLDLAMNKYN